MHRVHVRTSFKLLLLTAVLATTTVVTAGCESASTSPTRSVDDGPERISRLVQNFQHEIPQWREAQVTVDSLRSSPMPGLDEGQVTVNGQTYRFAVTPDDEQVVILASHFFDASRSDEELAELRAEEEEAARREISEREAMLEEFASGMPYRGNADAPVTIVEFSDYQCPYCKRGYTTVEEILQRYPNEVKFVYAHYPLPNHPWARPAAVASECAASLDENAYWALYQAYFQNQESITPQNVMAQSEAVLRSTGVDMAQWSTCVQDESSEAHQAAQQRVQEHMRLGQQLGVQGTPGFFVNGRFLRGARPLNEFIALIEQESVEAGTPGTGG